MRENEENKKKKPERRQGVGVGEKRTRTKNEGKEERDSAKRVESVEHVRKSGKGTHVTH